MINSLPMVAPSARRRKVANPPPPRDCDVIPEGMCERCGFPGPHVDAYDCIDALRDELATAQLGRENRPRKREA